jgi:predicted nucleotidyltransferase
MISQGNQRGYKMPRSAIEVAKITRKTIRLLKGHLSIQRGYLFGSYAYGEPNEYSDIDLAFFSPTIGKMSLDRKMTMLSEVGKKVGYEVEIHLYSSKCLKEARPTNFYGHILKTGKRVL